MKHFLTAPVLPFVSLRRLETGFLIKQFRLFIRQALRE